MVCVNMILYEMVYMWFGDFVIMIWWDDLWFKELFVDYMGVYVLVVVMWYYDVWVKFVVSCKVWVY